jgi:DNA-binding XRE family transcriptional regulator
MGASDLARSVGVTRQTIHAIEAGRYLPNTEVALRMARELGVAVEEIFSLPEEAGTPVSAAHLSSESGFEGQPAACLTPTDTSS